MMFVGIFLHANEPQKIVFAPLPLQSEESVFKTFAPMVHYLEKTLHVSISFHFSTSYEALLADIEKGSVDIAYLGPLPYIELKANASFVEPLIFFNEANGKPFYRCVLVAWGPSYEPLSKLNTYHSFALTDPF
jgi:phosphonate transport system substrate-binding protein